jgi:hypothetical protein
VVFFSCSISFIAGLLHLSFPMPPEASVVVFTVSSALLLLAAGVVLLARQLLGGGGREEALRSLALSLLLLVSTIALLLTLQVAPAGTVQRTNTTAVSPSVTLTETRVEVVYGDNPYAALYYLPLALSAVLVLLSGFRLTTEYLEAAFYEE